MKGSDDLDEARIAVVPTRASTPLAPTRVTKDEALEAAARAWLAAERLEMGREGS